MWFWFSIIALLCWSGSDLFSKIGCRDQNDKTAHLKMVMAVGVVMGLHAMYEVFINGVEINLSIIITYLPVSLLYILSMAIGYIGLRYIELSVSTPICNSSGAIVAIITIMTRGIAGINPWQIVAIFLVAGGIIMLGVTEANEDDELRAKRQEAGNYKYAKSFLALLLPIIYCLLDAAGTFADSIVLETLNEDSANVAYELTFLAAGAVSAIYVLCIRRERLTLKQEAPKYIGACFETVGQFFYIYALADTAHVAMSAPIISSYCAASVLWSRIFLKEKLSRRHYICLLFVFIGIVIMGIFEEA
ncbi:MAG: EamA family transporter [Clostridia bacterium]|nr:EamA family transporter [Clostridia bacterium]